MAASQRVDVTQLDRGDYENKDFCLNCGQLGHTELSDRAILSRVNPSVTMALDMCKAWRQDVSLRLDVEEVNVLRQFRSHQRQSDYAGKVFCEVCGHIGHVSQANCCPARHNQALRLSDDQSTELRRWLRHKHKEKMRAARAAETLADQQERKESDRTQKREARHKNKDAVATALEEAERLGLPGCVIDSATGRVLRRASAVDATFAAQCVRNARSALETPPPVCCVCDRFIFSGKVKTFPPQQFQLPLWHDKLTCPENSINPLLLAQYDCEELDSALKDIMLSPRGITQCEQTGQVKCAVCRVCRTALDNEHKTGLPPALAIANHNWIGLLPRSVFNGFQDKYMYETEMELLSLLMSGGSRYVVLDHDKSAGARNVQVLKGHMFAVRNQPLAVLQYLSAVPVQTDIHVIVASPLTTQQELLTRRAFRVRQLVLKRVAGFLCDNNAEFDALDIALDHEFLSQQPYDGPCTNVHITQDNRPQQSQGESASSQPTPSSSTEAKTTGV
jgi:hypothetical protein